jgi:hypothetical protein
MRDKAGQTTNAPGTSAWDSDRESEASDRKNMLIVSVRKKLPVRRAAC